MVQNYEKVTLSRKQIIVNNFIGGIFWGLGSTLGVALILTLIGFILHFVNFVPIIGNFATEINKYVTAHK